MAIQIKYDAKLKKRVWKFVFYPESLPSDWLDFLQNTDLPFCVSPLHDKDVNEDQENTTKKAHYHLIIAYGNTTTWQNVKKSICDPLGQPMPMPSDNIKLAYRYLWHADNPDKYQYDANDVKCYNGFNIHDYIALSNDEVKFYLNECTAMVRDGNIVEYCDLVFLLQDSEMWEALYVVQTHTIYFNALIRSLKYKTQGTDTIRPIQDTKQPKKAQDLTLNDDVKK